MRRPGPRLLAGVLLAVLLVGCARESSEAAVVAEPLPKAPDGGAPEESTGPLESAEEKAGGALARPDTTVRELPEEKVATPSPEVKVAAPPPEEKVAVPPPPEEEVAAPSPPPQIVPIELIPIAFGFDDPVHVTNAGDGTGRLFVVEKSGRVQIVQFGERLDEPFLDITDLVTVFGQEQGLLSIVFHPEFTTNGAFYVNYTDGSGATTIARYRAGPGENRADAGSGLVLLTIDQPFQNHNGGGMAFGPDGHLYVGMGDGGSANDPYGAGQDLDSLLGKMLRFDPSNPDVLAIPASNPFVGDPAARDEIWAYGLRNPWRFTFDRETGDLFIADVGQNAVEEVHFVARADLDGPALNFGWNVLEASACFKELDCDRAGMELPVAEYGRDGGCSITGGFVYRGSEQPALWGVYIYGDWCTGRFWGLAPDGAGGWRNEIVGTADIGLSSFGEEESGEMFATGLFSGGLYELVVAG